ncbi:MAG: hypothetical protein ABSA59_01110 [Terriglobia bacterium]|jgi:hypothetical protein
MASFPGLFAGSGVLKTGFLIAPVVVCGYFIWKAGFERFLFCTIIFPWKYYTAFGADHTFRVFFDDLTFPLTPGPLPHALALRFVLIATPLSYILFSLRRWQSTRRESGDHPSQLLLVATIGRSGRGSSAPLTPCPASPSRAAAATDRIVFGLISHLNRSGERKPPMEFAQNA